MKNYWLQHIGHFKYILPCKIKLFYLCTNSPVCLGLFIFLRPYSTHSTSPSQDGITIKPQLTTHWTPGRFELLTKQLSGGVRGHISEHTVVSEGGQQAGAEVLTGGCTGSSCTSTDRLLVSVIRLSGSTKTPGEEWGTHQVMTETL